MRKGSRFWLIYGIAWLPYTASYTSMFVSHVGRSFAGGLKESIFNVLPAALFGIGITVVCDKVAWSANHRSRFLTIHLLLAALYAVSWNAATSFLYRVDQRIEFGSWTYRPDSGNVFQRGLYSGVIIYATIAGILYAVQATERLRAEQARVAAAENLRTRAELETLRAQVNPHFLFNTLHSLMALVRHDPKAAEDALETLATLLRHSLMSTSEDQNVALSDELDFIQNYLSLESLRLGNRLRVEREIEPATLECRLPPFTLQPLIENSIKHAVGTLPEGCRVTIRSQRNNGILRLEVADDGPGADPGDVESSQGSGLRIARQRLRIHYAGAASFTMDTAPGKGFSVRIDLPMNQA